MAIKSTTKVLNEPTDLMNTVVELFPDTEFTHDAAAVFGGQLLGRMSSDGDYGKDPHGSVGVSVEGHRYASKVGMVTLFITIPFDGENVEIVPDLVEIATKSRNRLCKASAHAIETHRIGKLSGPIAEEVSHA